MTKTKADGEYRETTQKQRGKVVRQGMEDESHKEMQDGGGGSQRIQMTSRDGEWTEENISLVHN